MALRFNNVASGLQVTSGMPTTSSFTFTCWVYFVNTSAASVILHIMDNDSTERTYLARSPNLAGFQYEWTSGGAVNATFAMTAGVWYKVAVVVSGTTATVYTATASSALNTATNVGNFVLPTGTLKKRFGEWPLAGGLYGNWRLANYKMWHAALTKSQVEQELSSYVPQRTANLTHWYPLVRKELTDYSGNARTMTGGGTTTEEAGPPIPWSRLRVPVMPWDPDTEVWLAHYDTTTGELLSLGTVAPSPIPAGTALLALLGQPDQAQYEWSTIARTFVLREGVLLVDRVGDLTADAALTSVWATLDNTQDQALRDRVGQMLGPYRYRLDFQSPDLE